MQQSLFGSLISQPAVAETPVWSGSTALQDVVFTVIDLETTGLNARKNAITEITAIRYKNNVEIDKFSTFVKPTEPITPESEAITGINDAMVADAPPLVSVLTDLCSFVGTQPVIVGHNVTFDLKFLREKLEATGLSSFLGRFEYAHALCTKALAVKALPGLPNYDGVMVATHCGVYNPNPHRAEHDVRMSAGILFHIMDRLQRQDAAMRTLDQLLGYQGMLTA